ncbi:hypothetical protein Purlil1_12884 [Purpureocillium lilacinum]|uniref:Uncharacterized protein n=1 Tax=Purpureocillium lilacinum TaxID=33203 RepID=A0ABR0BFK0_PURLI|nr:hypothetical protein Purlil1_12884 [Purpureocillium lilacinum]
MSSPTECEAQLPRRLDIGSNQSIESMHYANSKALNQDAGDDYFLNATSKDVHYRQFGNANCYTAELKRKSPTADQDRIWGDSNPVQSQPLLQRSRLCGAEMETSNGTQAADAVQALERFKEHCGNQMQTELNALEKLLLDLASADGTENNTI